MRNAVIGSLKQMGEKDPGPVLAFARKHIHHPDPEVRREMVHGVELRGRTHPEDVLPLLEELQHARARGAQIYAEVIGYGSTGDAFRITDTHPEGRGAIATMTCALGDAGVAPKDIDYISAHGTSTLVNDRVESLAIREVFGDEAYNVPVSSIKSMFGHLIAAAGAVEAITCLLAMRDSMLPPTINYENPDPDCDLDYVPNQARRSPAEIVMSNSFGFGGQNICLVLRKDIL